MTISEKLFEQFCRENNIEFSRLLPDGNKTPDYEINLDDQHTILEIKEFALNDEEKAAINDFKKKGYSSWDQSKLGNRIRYKIDDSKRQIQRLASGKSSAILLLYDARPFPIKGISPYEIEVAMYGWESIDLHVPENLEEPVRFGKHRFGKGKKFRHDCHTYISAIGMLKEIDPTEPLHLDLYLNVYADIPLQIDSLITRKNITVFIVASGNGNEFRGWARIVPPGD